MSEQPTVIARHVATPLGVDELDNRVWSSASPVLIQYLWSGEPAPPERHAEVRLCWSDEGLHARFVCEQHEPLVVQEKPVINKKTLGLWDRDVCEIFLAPDARNPSIYYEFEAAPTGEWVDLAITMRATGRETEWDYSSGIQTATASESERIVISLTIPFSSRIPKPTVGNSWRVNLFRCVGRHPTERYLAWVPTRTAEPNFHVPEVFGWLRFE